MTFEQPKNANITTDAILQPEEISASEKVLLAQLESNLKSLTVDSDFPTVDSMRMTEATKFLLESMCVKIADSYIKKGTAPGLIIVARMIEWMGQNNLDSGQVNDVVHGNYLNEQARYLYENNLDNTGGLKDACLLQKYFGESKDVFLRIAESKREILKQFALSYTDGVVKSAFEILPSLENDEDLKVDAKKRLAKVMGDKSGFRNVAELVRTYPKNFFTPEEILPAVIAMLEYELGRSREFKADSINEAFLLTKDESDLVVDKMLDKSLSVANIRFAQALAAAYGVNEEVLQTKASIIYEKSLRDHNHRNQELVVKIAPLVSEEFKSQEEIVSLKREWALENITIGAGYPFSYTKSRGFAFKEQFNLSDDYLSKPESQKKIQEQLLSTLSYGNYSIAVELYDEFLTDESKTSDFKEQIEASFLHAIQRSTFRLVKDSHEAKLIDIFSEAFKQTPQFREQVEITLSSLFVEANPEDVNFAIEKFECSNEEIRKAKERALLSVFAYVSRDGGKVSVKSPEDRIVLKAREHINTIQPDEEIFNSVRIKLINAVLQNESIYELKSLRIYAQFLGMSDSQIIEQEKIKEIICRDITASIQKGELNNAISTGKAFKLAPEDIAKIDKDIVVGGIKWWLEEELKALNNAYGNWKHVSADIDGFVRFFDLSQEELFLDKQIRSHGGKLLLTGRLFYHLEDSRIVETLTKTLLITEEDMMNSVDTALQSIIQKDNADDQKRYLEKMVEMLPGLPTGFADQALAESYLANIDSYPVPDKSTYGRRPFRERRNKDICDFLIEKMNLMQTFEAKQRICTQTFVYLVNQGAFETVNDLLYKRKALPFVSREVRHEALLPEYVRIFTEQGEDNAARFAKLFEIDVSNIADERIQKAYQRMFKELVMNGNIEGIVSYSKKAQFSPEFLNSPEIKNALEQAFISNLSEGGLEMAIKLTQSGLINVEFLHTEQVRIAARSYVPNLLSSERYADIVTLNSQLSLGITPQEIITLDSEKERFFEKLDAGFPRLSAKCRGSLDALFSLWPHIHLLDTEILDKYPFLAEALQENDRFGSKLLLKFQSLDKLSQANIQTLYKHKAEILSQNNIEPESRDFRISMQQRLEGYRRNSEISQTLRRAGINVEEWLNHEDEVYFTLGRDENLRFSETIVTPIERIQETINAYTATIKEVLEDYKNDLLEVRVPLKDAALLQSQLDRLIEQRQIAVQGGDVNKIDGISKGIANIEKQMSETKDIPLWDKVMSSIASLDLVKKDIFKAYTHLCDVEILLNQKEADTNMSNTERRKELLKLKKKIDSSKKELGEKVQLLGVRLAEFDKGLYHLLFPALGEDRADALIQEKNELAQEHIDHYQSDSKTLINLFYQKEDDNLVGQHMKIGLWDRNPNKDLYLGNYTDCCIRIDSAHMGAESTIADYLTDVGVQVVLVTDEKKNIPVVAAWCWIGHDDNDQVAFVVDNIEANTDYSANFRNQLEVKLKEYIQHYSNKVGAKLVQGRNNNDLVIANMDSAYFKLGGYNRPSGYFLEGEDNGDFGGGMEEDPEQWDENE